MILPTGVDVIRSLTKAASWDGDQVITSGTERLELEFVKIEVRDLAIHLLVATEELRHCVGRRLEEGKAWVWPSLRIGFRATPLLMGRVAAAMARLLQSLCRPWETMLQCYMDELLVMVQGAKAQHDQALAMTVLTMQVLRVRIETRRASRGPSVSWMGVTPSANGSSSGAETSIDMASLGGW